MESNLRRLPQSNLCVRENWIQQCKLEIIPSEHIVYIGSGIPPKDMFSLRLAGIRGSWVIFSVRISFDVE